jgi:hypothetical protein
MLSFHSPYRTRLCDGLDRRQWLQVGGLGAFGLGLEQLLARPRIASAGEMDSETFGKAKSCIVLFLLGGPPQHETWDPKPDAPVEVRGDLKSIQSALPGLRVGELMPKTAQLVDKIAVLRGMSTDDNAHSASGYWMLTGRPHEPRNRENAPHGPPNDDPCIAAMIRHLRGDTASMPGSIVLPEDIWNTGRIAWPGQDAGWLGPNSDPWLIMCDPNADKFQVPSLAMQEGITPMRVRNRGSLLTQLNSHLDQVHRGDRIRHWSSLRQRAFNMLTAPTARKAFAIESEPAKVRERYGRNRFGQSVLLARRLVEAGVSMVQVNWTRWDHDKAVAPAWDTHAGNSERLKKDLMPQMDMAYSSLLEDLQQRGLLDETLVVWMGEFGRTPKINARGGRDHWGHVYSIALAGAGIRGGTVYGSSDRIAGFPTDGRHEPQDLAATIFHLMGHSPQTEIHDRQGRPAVISTGDPIQAILT